MSNPYYTPTNVPTYRAFGSSSVQRNEFAAVATGFDAVYAAILAATVGSIPTASESTNGSVRLATVAEATAGTDTAKAVTAAGVRASLSAGVTVTASSTNTTYNMLFHNSTSVLSNSGCNLNPSTGALAAVSFNSTSTRDSKDHITVAEFKALDIIDKTEIVCYTYKADDSKALRVGFIADDTHSIMAGPDHNKFDINNTVGVLLKAVQELAAEVRYLRARVQP